MDKGYSSLHKTSIAVFLGVESKKTNPAKCKYINHLGERERQVDLFIVSLGPEGR